MRLTLLATPSFKVELNQSCVMYKSILLPAFIASVIAMPLIYQKSTSAPRLPNGQNGQSWSQGPRAPYNQQVGLPQPAGAVAPVRTVRDLWWNGATSIHLSRQPASKSGSASHGAIGAAGCSSDHRSSAAVFTTGATHPCRPAVSKRRACFSSRAAKSKFDHRRGCVGHHQWAFGCCCSGSTSIGSARIGISSRILWHA